MLGSWALRTEEEKRESLKLQRVESLMPAQEGPCLVSLGTVLGCLDPVGLERRARGFRVLKEMFRRHLNPDSCLISL